MSEGTLLDTFALVVKLDPADFLLGAKRIDEELERTKASSRKAGEEMEDSGKQAAKFFEEIQSRALKLGALLLGGVGLKELIQNSIKSGTAIGFAAQNIGISAQQVSKWRNVVRGLGFDAEEVAPSLQQLSQRLADIKLSGKDNTGLYPALASIGITDLIDHATGGLKTVEQLLPEIHKGLTALDEHGKRRYNAQDALDLANRIGLSPGLIQALLQEDKAYDASIKRADRAAKLTKDQTDNFQRLTGVTGDYFSELESTGYEAANLLVKSFDWIVSAGGDIKDFFGALGKVIEDIALVAEKTFPGLGTFFRPLIRDLKPLSDLLALIKKNIFALSGVASGIAFGAAAGSAVPVVGTVAGGVVGGIVGLIGGHTADKTREDYAEPDAPVAPGTPPKKALGAAPASSTGAASRAAPSGASGSWGASPGPGLASDRIFRIIQTLEGGKADTKTPTKDPNDPYAYGKNQITLGTAKSNDKDATVEKLLDPVYNDAMAKKIEEKYLKKYKGNSDAIAIAYHNGEGAADQFVRQHGSTEGIEGFGDQSQKYLSAFRRDYAKAGGDTNNSQTTSVTVGTVNVNTNAKDAPGIASGMKTGIQLAYQAPGGPN